MKTTRRSVLKGGGKAVVAVATLPFLSTINPAQAQEDAEIFALYERCRWLEKKYMAAVNRHDEVWLPIRRQFPEYPLGAKPEALVEAEARAGLPALEKKQDAALDDWSDAEDRFYDMRAHTPEGMILKLTLEWSDRTWRRWRAKDPAHHIDYHPDAIPSILMDLERLAGVAS